MSKIVDVLTQLTKKNPSIQYYFFDTDSIVFGYSKGFANISANTQVSSSTTYNAYSITKTFTALAILLLAEEGKIDVNKPASSYSSNFPYGTSITVKQLLNHTSGIPNPLPISWIHLTSEHSTFDSKAFVEKIVGKNPQIKSQPNQTFRYSNLAYLLLGELIEKVSGMDYERYVRQHIIEKLQLDEADLSFTIASEANHAVGYQKQWSLTNLLLSLLTNKAKYMGKSVRGWKPFNNFYVNGKSYGGLVGKPSAFIAYAQELLRNNSALVSDKVKRQLFEENTTSAGRKTGMCLSWFKGVLNGETYYTHAGGGGGYYCEIRVYKELGKGSVVFFNRSGMTDERLLDRLDKFYIHEQAPA